MTRPRLRVKPSLRDTLRASQRACDFYADSFGKPRVALGEPIPEKRTRRPNGHDGKPLEKDVQAAILDYLAMHPNVALLIRNNSGGAYDTSGNYLKFHAIYKPRKVRRVDIEGLLKSGRPFAFEVKRPGWTRPTDEREEEQQRYLNVVRDAGGIGAFATSVDDVMERI